ncbi:trimethylamine methyltransferase family protein, partial [Defluviimonas sp. WL0024]
MSEAAMTTEKRTTGRRARAARGGGAISQLEFRDVQNPYAPLELATPDQVEAIHRTSMRILSELGIRVMSTRVMELFEAAGAIVDRAAQTIRIDESLVAEALKTVPSSFTLTSRNAAKRLTMGG